MKIHYIALKESKLLPDISKLRDDFLISQEFAHNLNKPPIGRLNFFFCFVLNSSGSSSDHGRRRSISSVFGKGPSCLIWSNTYVRYTSGFSPFKRAVSVMLYTSALASAPRILFANSQFRRPTAKFLIARSALLLSILR